MRPIIGILGPTAAGKSSLAMALAADIKTEIISADSMQIYRGFDIGTAKPTKEEQLKVRHHLIDIADPQENFSSYLFKQKAEEKLKEFEARDLVPLIVGGTGFFIKNLLYQFDFEEGENFLEVRKKLTEAADKHGKKYVHDLLKSVDERSAQSIHENDVKKVIRALEIYYTTGKKKSDGTNSSEQRFKNILFVLNKDRKELYAAIDKRVDKMMGEGLTDEVKRLHDTVPAGSISLMGIGYKELIGYFDGNYSLQEAIDLIKQHTRNYAKRQITYFKKLDAIWLDADLPQNELIAQIKANYFEEFDEKL